MRTLKAMIAGAALVCGVAGPAAAQRGGRMGRMDSAGRAGAGQNAGALVSRQLLRGITLTDAQKTALQKAQDDGRTQMQALTTTAQANREAARTARENGDTIALNRLRAQTRGDANRRIALRAQQVQRVRGLLTPDQQKQFDENRTRLRNRVGRAMGAMRQRRMAMRRGAMMRAMAPRAGMRMQMRGGRGFGRGGFGPGGGMQFRGGQQGPGGGFGPGGGMRMRGGRGGGAFGPGAQRGPGGPGAPPPPPPDSTAGGGN